MCQIGDIILVYNPIRNRRPIGTHSFLVLDDSQGQIRGLDFDFVGLIMSSMDTEQKHDKLMRYDGNFSITPDEQDIKQGGNGKRACVKAEQFYYFNKNRIRYRVIGRMNEDVFNLLLEFIKELNDSGMKFQQILDNT